MIYLPYTVHSPGNILSHEHPWDSLLWNSQSYRQLFTWIYRYILTATSDFVGLKFISWKFQCSLKQWLAESSTFLRYIPGWVPFEIWHIFKIQVVVVAVTTWRSVYSETWRAPTPPSYHTHGCRSETSVYINRNDLGWSLKRFHSTILR